MDRNIIQIIQTQNGEPLQYFQKKGVDYLQSANGVKFKINNGILSCIDNVPITGNNKNYQIMYDRFAGFYDTATKFYAFLKNGNEKKRVMQYLSLLDIKDGDRVIEISIGTGRNIKYLNSKADFFGVDISIEMLKQCQKKMKRLKREITLIQAEAEFLPIKDESFDVVFSAGGFNFFNNPGKAVNEMLRIAKSGTKILLTDETEKLRSKFSKNEFYSNIHVKRPTDYLPEYCQNIEYKEICNGDLYVLTFNKPI